MITMHHEKSGSSSANVIGHNDDLLTEILLLVPVKSLIRFKLVSKRWYSLISAASFYCLHILNHRRRHRQHLFIRDSSVWQYLISDRTFKRLTRLQVPFSKNIIIDQSCNGLLLLRSAKRCICNYFIFNPTTMQHRKLGSFSTWEHSVTLHLLFDPSRSPHYKVVRFKRWVYYSDLLNFYVYDSATHEWTDCGGSLLPGMRWHHSYEAVSCNNRIYYFINGTSIASFYYSVEENQVFRIPYSAPNDIGVGIRIMESNGHMHCVRLWANPRLDIYEMIDNKWVHCLSVDEEHLKVIVGGFDGERNNMPWLAGMIRGERLEDSIVLVGVSDQIGAYSLSDKDLRSHCLSEDDESVSYTTSRKAYTFTTSRKAYTFTESWATV